jgi:hypothetical protein
MKKQLGFEFGECDLNKLSDYHLEKAFGRFHKKNPHVWRAFRTEALEAINRGEIELRAHDIMKRIAEKVYVEYQFTRFYLELFTGNHQELAHVFVEDFSGDRNGNNT